MVLGVIHLVAPKATLLPLKAFQSDGTGYLSDILRAIYYAVSAGANAINMSFDFPSSSSELASALNFASQSGLICAASAGNDGQEEIVYPAALQTYVMGVASTSDLDTRSSFSNYGDPIVWVAAPGEAIVTTYPFSTYAAGWGTSFSAPFVSGGSALLLSKLGNINESQAAAAIAHAVPVGAGMGNGRLDLVQAFTSGDSAGFRPDCHPSHFYNQCRAVGDLYSHCYADRRIPAGRNADLRRLSFSIDMYDHSLHHHRGRRESRHGNGCGANHCTRGCAILNSNSDSPAAAGCFK